MALADYTPPRVAILSNGSPLMEVRGLSLEDVATLVRVHMEDLQRMYQLAQNAKESSDFLGAIAQEGFILKLLTDAPILAGQIIAMAADEPDLAATARRLPASIQVQTLSEVLRLTCEDVGGPKAFVALLRAMMPAADSPLRAPTIQ